MQDIKKKGDLNLHTLANVLFFSTGKCQGILIATFGLEVIYYFTAFLNQIPLLTILTIFKSR